MFDPIPKMALGLITGIVFGFLLQKGRVAKFDVIVGQFLLKDWRVVKTMLTAIAVGAIGVYAMVHAGMAELHIKPFAIGGVLIGAVLFGIGLAVFGLCPGTSVAASGEGNRHAMIGVLGMLAGATAFVVAYPGLEPAIKAFGDHGKITFPEVFAASPRVWVAGTTLAIVAFLVAIEVIERVGNRRRRLNHRAVETSHGMRSAMLSK